MSRKFLAILLVFATLASVLASGSLPATAQPTAARTGAWVDSITFTSAASDAEAVGLLQANQIDIYADGIADPALFPPVETDPNLTYSQAYGSYNELTFNPVGPEFNDGRLNPFSNRKLREAINKLIDRRYIVETIYGGLATPRFLPISFISGDRERYQETFWDLEYQYRYNLSTAINEIATQMLLMGATKNTDSKWQYNDVPIVVIFLIRTEDKRRQIGDYVADQLELAGFDVSRLYKTSAEARPLWIGSDPAEGLWHIYTGGWVTTSISRDDGSNFSFFYLPYDYASNPWYAYEPTPEFEDVALRLRDLDFTTLDVRDALFKTALDLSMEDSVRVWIVDQHSFFPRQADTLIANDLSSGTGAQAWPYTVRFTGTEGGNMRMAMPSILVDPWNPLNGSNWVYDANVYRATQDYALLSDPATGLVWPQRLESAAVVAQTGLPIAQTHEWLKLSFEPTITVPADAWVDWDATGQKFINAGDMYGTDLPTARIKYTVTYPADLFDTVKWHDGSPLSLGDFVLNMILKFDRAKPESPIYDDSTVSTYDAFMATFRGVRIVSDNPLVIETYTDQWQLDAELGIQDWWPNYATGPGAWHTLGLGIRAEEENDLMFSADKAGALEKPWMSYIEGESLTVLATYLIQSTVNDYLPYAPTLGDYVTQAEIDARWANLQSWYASQGHFWLGTGPFYLESANYVTKSVLLNRFANFPDPADKWDCFTQAPSLTLNFDTGAPGSYFTVTGENFPPLNVVHISVNTVELSQAVTDIHGGFTVVLSTEAGAAEGYYDVVATVNPEASTFYILDVVEEVRPLESTATIVPVPDDVPSLQKLFLSLIYR